MGCFNSAVINAPADRVWAALRNFHDMSWAPGVVESCEKAGSAASDQIGAKRVLNGAFHETLLGLDDPTRTLRYSIDDGPEALSSDNVQGYIGDVRVLAVTDTDQSVVLWYANWESEGSQDVGSFCSPIYQALLGELKKHFG